jgi:iron(III) transport system ATP-binding protein
MFGDHIMENGFTALRATKTVTESLVLKGNSTAVVLRGIVKNYENASEPAVSNVSFDVVEGEFLVLLGPSGCGKTTTLRLIAGLEEADAGEILFGSEFVDQPAASIFVPTERRNIGMVFQSYAIWPHMSVFENVAYPLKIRGKSSQEIQELVTNALSLVGLQDYAKRGSTQLSGGQQQRVALARSLVFNPRVLLLDEPLSNLDARLRIQMRQELKRLQRKIGLTTILVTHDQSESMSLADRIIVMNKGKIEQIGSPEEIYEHPRNRFVSEFIGSANFVNAIIEDVDQGRMLATVKFGDTKVSLSTERLSQRLDIGSTAVCTIRPEHLTLSRELSLASDHFWRGRILDSEYYGDRRNYSIMLNIGTIIKISCRSDQKFHIDDNVIALWTPDNLSILDES